jgi:hypothetical protein
MKIKYKTRKHMCVFSIPAIASLGNTNTKDNFLYINNTASTLPATPCKGEH